MSNRTIKNKKIEEFIKNQNKENLIVNMSKELKEFENDICKIYSFKFSELFIPPIDIIKKVCISYDKTYLFISSFIRLTIFIILTKTYYEYMELKKANNWKKYFLGFFILLFYSIINIVLLFIIVFKNQKYEKQENL